MVDRCLADVSDQVGSELDSTVKMLEVVRLIPTHPNNDLISALHSSNEEGKMIANILSRQWRLEARWQKLNTQNAQNEEHNRTLTKTKEHLSDATRELVATLLESSESTRNLFITAHRTTCDKTHEESSSLVNTLSESLLYLKEIVCENISTTVQEEEKYNVEVQKLREKCEILSREKEKLKSSLQEKNERYSSDVTRLSNTLNALKEELEDTKKTEITKQDQRNAENNSIVEEERKKHDEKTESLQAEFNALQEELHSMRKRNKVEEAHLMARRKELEKKKDEIIRLHETSLNEKRQNIQSIKAKMKEEMSERERLEQRFALEDLNRDIICKEEEILKKRQEMEDRADKILANGSIQLQRLFRGMRDRAIVTKLKKKKKGKGKKGGKGKGKKSNGK